VVASDDYGIKTVALSADGVPVASLGHMPYELAWTPAYAQIGKTVALTAKVTDSAGQTSASTVHVSVSPVTTTKTGTVSGTVPATLALAVDGPASFGAFVPGVGDIYVASTTAKVTSSAGDALLSVIDPSATAPGHLVNGGFSLPSALQVRARNAATQGSAYNFLGSAPYNLLAYSAPISNDAVALDFRQTIAGTDALRTGTYRKTLTFTLSTTTP
jgi:hypothetical protein